MNGYEFSLDDQNKIFAEVIAAELDQRTPVQQLADEQLPMQDLLNAIGAALGGNQNPVKQFVDTWAGNLDWLTDIGSNWNSAIQQIVDHISAAVGGAGAGNGLGTVQDNIGSVFQTAVVAQATATAAQIAIQQIGQNENAGAGGLNKLLTFQGAPLSTTDWSYIPAAFSVANNMMVVTGGAGQGQYLARANYSFATDNQAVVAQLGSEANNDQFTYLCLRVNASGTQGMAVRISANSLAIGYFTHDGGSNISFTPIVGTGRAQYQGSTVEFRAVADNFLVLVDGGPVLTTTYSGAGSNIGSSWRNAAVVKQKAIGFLTFYSFNISSFGMYDYGTSGSAVTSRVAARLSRLSNATVNVSVANGGDTPFPQNYFTAIDFAQGMTVTDLINGTIRIDSSDWYQITAAFSTRYAADSDFFGQSHWCLYVNGERRTHALLAGTTFRYPLSAGDVVQLGVFDVMTGVLSTGNGDASKGVTRPIGINGISGGPGAFFQIVADK